MNKIKLHINLRLNINLKIVKYKLIHQSGLATKIQ